MRMTLVSCVLASSLIACAGEDVTGPSTTRRDDASKPAKTNGDAKTNETTANGTTNTAPTTDDAKVVTPGATKATPDVIDKAPAAPAVQAPAAKVALVSMNMSFSDKGDWLMSRDASEGAGAGYHFNGVAYRVFEAPPADEDTKPLYRCLDPQGTHFQSNDFLCEKAGKLESLLGYVYVNDPGNGAKPISRCIGESGAPIVSTTRLADCDPFIVQPVHLGFAFDASVREAP